VIVTVACEWEGVLWGSQESVPVLGLALGTQPRGMWTTEVVGYTCDCF
jgi:hypothetical protein